MNITVCCCTYNRPTQLGYLLRCFEQQTHQVRHMVIFDDAGQYPDQPDGANWRLVSTSKRCGSLGEKRNRVAELACELWPDTEAFAIWDDDDLYLSWALAADVAALQAAEWSRPSLVLQPVEDGRRWWFRQYQTGGLYHGGWAYRREMFERMGGYAAGYSGPEDQEFMHRMEAAGVSQCDPVGQLNWAPAYIYPWGQASGGPHISGLLTGRDKGEEAWRRFGMMETLPAKLTPANPPWFDLSNPYIEPGINPRPF